MTAPAVGISGHQGTAAPPAGLPRLLAGLGSDVPAGLSEHLGRWGHPRMRSGRRASDLTREIDRAGLRGRGGAWFPSASRLTGDFLIKRK